MSNKHQIHQSTAVVLAFAIGVVLIGLLHVVPKGYSPAVQFMQGSAAALCDANTSPNETISVNGVTRWCRNMNADGWKWVVAQYCESGCPAGATYCQNNPVGITAQAGGAKLICNGGKWIQWSQITSCGDQLCTPEYGENDLSCTRDCKGVSDVVVDTTGYWPLKPGNYWVYDGKVTGDMSIWPIPTMANIGDTFSTVLFTEPKETICGKNYYPVAFYKDKQNGYWQFGTSRNIRFFASEYRKDFPSWTDDYIVAPITKLYKRNPADPFSNAQSDYFVNMRSTEPASYPPYIILPHNLRINKTILTRQDSLTTNTDFTTCEWMNNVTAGQIDAAQIWRMQFGLESVVTPAYSGPVLRVRFDERGQLDAPGALEDWYFAKGIGVVRIHRYYPDWKNSAGSTKFDLLLREYGNAPTPPNFLPEQPAKRGWTSICGKLPATGALSRSDAFCASGDGAANGKNWTSSCSAKWSQATIPPAPSSCIYAIVPSQYSLMTKVGQSWNLTVTPSFTGWIDSYTAVSGPVKNSIYSPGRAKMSNGSVTMPAFTSSGTYLMRFRPADDSAAWSGEVKITVSP